MPPHSLEAEKALLGSVMLDHGLLDELAHVPADAFYAERHRILWDAMNALVARGRDPDHVQIIDYLRTHELLDRVGSVPYVMGLPDETSTAAYAPSYAATVMEHHKRRHLIELCQRTISDAEGDELDTVLEEHENRLTTLSRYHALDRSPADYYQDALDLVTGAAACTTGFLDLDRALGGGLMRGGYNVIAARPSMGKSALLRRIVTHRAEQGDRVSLFSIDQSGGEIYALEACLRAGTPMSSFKPDRRSGRVRATPHDRERLERELVYLRDVWSERVRVHDSRAELFSIVAKAREDIRNGTTIVAVDHAQSLLVDGQSDDTNTVSRVSRTLKALCREWNVTLVLLSQLGRAVESREDRRPHLRDLRQSGAIEEDANAVLMLYREDYYQLLADPSGVPTNEAEVIIAKNKIGPTPGLARLVWRPQFAAFASAADPRQVSAAAGVYN